MISPLAREVEAPASAYFAMACETCPRQPRYSSNHPGRGTHARRATLTLAALLGLLAAALTTAPVSAMPNFAQALGVDCSACHIAVPGLKSYGRYMQRSAFTAIPAKTLERALPIWFSEQATYDTQADFEPHHTQLGNANFHLDGGVGSDVTFHIQQWLVEGDQVGTLDTAWVAYNNLIHREAHLLVGLMPFPSPSFYPFWFDIAAFASAEYQVGEHAEALDANRWGYQLDYEPKNFALEAGWGSAGYPADVAFTSDNDKAFQWRAAYTKPTNPLELGMFGSVGTVPLAEGGIDRYNTVAAYAELDPVRRWPGALLSYNIGYDGNPIATGQPATSHSYAAEVYYPLFTHWQTLVSARTEMTMDGLGTTLHQGNVDFNFRIAKFLRGTVEEGFASNSTPAWRWQIWWATPLMRCCLTGN